jgi:hypothetical protein
MYNVYFCGAVVALLLSNNFLLWICHGCDLGLDVSVSRRNFEGLVSVLFFLVNVSGLVSAKVCNVSVSIPNAPMQVTMSAIFAANYIVVYVTEILLV